MPTKDEFNNERTLREERSYVEMIGTLADLQTWYDQYRLKTDVIPAEWDRIEAAIPVRPPQKVVSIRLDEDVARWFRAMGLGHQRRMNAVLRAYMLATISRVIESKKNLDWKGDPMRGR
ncbi:MAG: BrnA antitoxin family protein [Pikeienuella sp.]|uniref:BrnA antitoxin family protein n=1 Tax=Pikeienuella sp. TaxID=2831957 RepID=UPI003918B9A3